MCGFRWCGRQLCLRNMPISGVNATPRPTAVYASDPASPRRPQDSLPSCLLGFERTRLSLASSFQLSSRTPHPAFRQTSWQAHGGAARVVVDEGPDPILPVDFSPGKWACSSSGLLASFGEKAANALADMMIERAVRGGAASLAEVSR